MSKAVLVLENMPKNCMECPLCDNFDCAILKRRIERGENTRLNNCPLKQLPEKRKELKREEYEFGNLGLAFDTGYNCCLNDIQK